MIKAYVINKYLSKEFLKVVFNTSFIFFCLGLILNLFEEINFFKDYNVSFSLPLVLSILFVPSLFYNMFPFIILLSGIWFFLKIKKTDEVISLKVVGLSNLSIIIVPSILSIILGIFFITSLNPIFSLLIKKYESVKGSYEIDQEYLAAITENGIWIKEKSFQKNYLIRSTKLEDNKLLNISIYQFDINNNFEKRIEAEYADIRLKEWKLINAKVISDDGEYLEKDKKNLTHISIYDINKLKTLYSNLDTVSFWSLGSEIKLHEDRGYSSKKLRGKLHQSLSFPFFLLSMVLLSGVFTLGTALKEKNLTYVFIALLTSVLIFYFNRFSAALGTTGKLPIELSIWMPIFIIFIFGTVGMMHANQK